MLPRGGWWQVTLLEVPLRCHSSCECSFAMGRRRVPELQVKVEVHAGEAPKAKGKPKVSTTSPAKIKAKRRGTVFASFCKIYFAKNVGGHQKLKEAALAWSMLTPKQKAKHADRQCEEKDKDMHDETIDVAPPTAPLGSSDNYPESDSGGLSPPKYHDIRVGNYTVVQGQAAIGSGSYGQALEVEHRSGRRMAMKLFHDKDLGLIELAAYRVIEQATEDAMVNEAACPFLRIYDFCTQPPLIWMTLPLVGGGDLWKQMKRRKFGECETIKIMYDAWLALKFLHEKAGILHLDVKPQNMMMGDNGKLFIIDFSLWERWPVPAQRELSHAYCTQGFRAPEVCETRHMTQEHLRGVVRPAVDWWSLGCSGACLAWAAMAEPRRRPQFFLEKFGSAESRDRELERVCPVGTYLRPVLDTLLDMDPNKRRLVGGAVQLFDRMKAHLPHH